MKLAVCVQIDPSFEPLPLTLLQGSLSEKVRSARKLEFDGIEIVPVDPKSVDAKTLHSEVEKSSMDVVAVASGAMASRRGLTLIHSDSGVMKTAFSCLLQLVDLATFMCAPLVTIGSFRGYVESLGSEGRNQLISLIKKAGYYAEDKGIRIVVEPLNRYETDLIFNVEQGLKFIEEVDHPQIGLLLDTFHMNIEETSWIKPFERAMASGKLWHIHLGDNNRLAPGQGMIDFSTVINSLKRLGYDGALSAEVLAKPDPYTAAVYTAKSIRPLLKKL